MVLQHCTLRAPRSRVNFFLAVFSLSLTLGLGARITNPNDGRSWSGATLDTFASLYKMSRADLVNTIRMDDGILENRHTYVPGTIVANSWSSNSGNGGCKTSFTNVDMSVCNNWSCYYPYTCENGLSIAAAANTIDHVGIQTPTGVGHAVWQFDRQVTSALISNNIDHNNNGQELPDEAIEATVYVSNVPPKYPPDPNDWHVAKVACVFLEGSDATQLWDGFVFGVTMPNRMPFRYVSISHGGPMALRSDGDDEINGVVGGDLNCNKVSSPPTITDIPKLYVPKNGNSGPVPFSISDPDTPVNQLVVSVLENSGHSVQLGGSGSSRTATITPNPGFLGSFMVEIMVLDGAAAASNRFEVVVRDAPTISAIPRQVIRMNTNTGPIGFSVRDADTPATSLTLSVSGNTNGALIASSGMAFGGSGESRTISLTPKANQYGTTRITVTVSDGFLSASTSFDLVVLAPPTISDINKILLIPTESSGKIPFTVSDPDTPARDLTVTETHASSEFSSVILSGDGGTRFIEVVGRDGVSGEKAITLTVKDAPNGASDSTVFLVLLAYPPAITDPGLTRVYRGDSADISIPISDRDTAASNLQLLIRVISNENILERSELVLSGNGATRNLKVTPNPNGNTFGRVQLTLEIRDGLFTRTEEIEVHVHAKPVIHTIPYNVVPVGTATVGPIPFQVTDADSVPPNVLLSVAQGSTVASAVEFSAAETTSRSATVTISDTSYVGDIVITLRATDEFGGEDTEAFTIKVANPPQMSFPPTLDAVEPLHNAEEVRYPFAVGDLDTPAASLEVTPLSSSNPGLLPTSRISFIGEGADRQVVFTPLPGEHGTTTITFEISDGELTTQTTMTFTVTAPPTISQPEPITTTLNTPGGLFVFQVADPDTDVNDLEFTILQTDNDELCPLTSLTAAEVEAGFDPASFGKTIPGLSRPSGIAVTPTGPAGSQAELTLVVSPPPNKFGSCELTVEISDGTAKSTKVIKLTVTAPPVILRSEKFCYLAHDENSTVSTFAARDPDTVEEDLEAYVLSSSDPTVVDTDAIVLERIDSGEWRVLVVNEQTMSGISIITIVVTDGTSSASFELEISKTHRPLLGLPEDGRVSAVTNALILPLGNSVTYSLYVEDKDTHVDDLELQIVSITPSHMFTRDQITILSKSTIDAGAGLHEFVLELTPIPSEHGRSDVVFRVVDLLDLANQMNITTTEVRARLQFDWEFYVEDTQPQNIQAGSIGSGLGSDETAGTVAGEAVGDSTVGPNDEYGGTAQLGNTVPALDCMVWSELTIQVLVTDSPRLSPIPTIEIPQGGNSGCIPVHVGDKDTPSPLLFVYVADMSNPGLFDNAPTPGVLSPSEAFVPEENPWFASHWNRVKRLAESTGLDPELLDQYLEDLDLNRGDSVYWLDIHGDLLQAPSGRRLTEDEVSFTHWTSRVGSWSSGRGKVHEEVPSGPRVPATASRKLTIDRATRVLEHLASLTHASRQGYKDFRRHLTISNYAVQAQPVFEYHCVDDTPMHFVPTPGEVEAGQMALLQGNASQAPLYDHNLAPFHDVPPELELDPTFPSIAFAGVYENRSLLLKPKVTAVGETTIRLMVSDGTAYDTKQFRIVIKPADCGEPEVPPNANVTYNGTIYTSIATYQCEEGYIKLTKVDQRRCEWDGKWYGNLIACAKPPTIEFGAFGRADQDDNSEEPSNGNLMDVGSSMPHPPGSVSDGNLEASCWRWSSWTPWSPCTITCRHLGTQERYRGALRRSLYHSVDNPHDVPDMAIGVKLKRRQLAALLPEWAHTPAPGDWASCQPPQEYEQYETRSCLVSDEEMETASHSQARIAGLGTMLATATLEIVGHAAVLAMGAGPVGVPGAGEWMTSLSEGTGVGGANPMDVMHYSQSSVLTAEQVDMCDMPQEYRQFALPFASASLLMPIPGLTELAASLGNNPEQPDADDSASTGARRRLTEIIENHELHGELAEDASSLAIYGLATSLGLPVAAFLPYTILLFAVFLVAACVLTALIAAVSLAIPSCRKAFQPKSRGFVLCWWTAAAVGGMLRVWSLFIYILSLAAISSFLPAAHASTTNLVLAGVTLGLLCLGPAVYLLLLTRRYSKRSFATADQPPAAWGKRVAASKLPASSAAADFDAFSMYATRKGPRSARMSVHANAAWKPMKSASNFTTSRLVGGRVLDLDVAYGGMAGHTFRMITGGFISDFKAPYVIFFLIPRVVLPILSAAAVATLRFSAIAQIAVLAVLPLAWLLLILFTRPFRDSFQLLMELTASAARFFGFALMISFTPSLGLDAGSRVWVAWIIAGLHITMFLLFILAIIRRLWAVKSGRVRRIRLEDDGGESAASKADKIVTEKGIVFDTNPLAALRDRGGTGPGTRGRQRTETITRKNGRTSVVHLSANPMLGSAAGGGGAMMAASGAAGLPGSLGQLQGNQQNLAINTYGGTNQRRGRRSVAQGRSSVARRLSMAKPKRRQSLARSRRRSTRRFSTVKKPLEFPDFSNAVVNPYMQALKAASNNAETMQYLHDEANSAAQEWYDAQQSSYADYDQSYNESAQQAGQYQGDAAERSRKAAEQEAKKAKKKTVDHRWRLVRQKAGLRRKSLKLTAVTQVLRAVQMFEHKIKNEMVVDGKDDTEHKVVKELPVSEKLLRMQQQLKGSSVGNALQSLRDEGVRQENTETMNAGEQRFAALVRAYVATARDAGVW